MKDHSNRVSQASLADAIASAMAVEEQRIEQIGHAAVEQVSGGLGSGDIPDGTTMGYFPPPN